MTALSTRSELQHAGSLRPSLASKVFCPPSAEPSHAVVEAKNSIFPPQIQTGDLLCIDFTRNSLAHDGLYVVAIADQFGPWIGIRRFEKTATGWEMSEDLSGQPPTILSADTLQALQVVGHIKQVYSAQGKGAGS